MKKLVLAVAALGLISLTSCKKDYTCTCKVSGSEIKTEIKDVKKSKAKDGCSALETQSKMIDANASCSL